MNEYKNEPKASVWMYLLLILIVLLPGFIGGMESEVRPTVKFVYQD